MFWQKTLVTSLLAMGAHAGITEMFLEGLQRDNPAVERRLQEIAKASIMARGYIEVRQTTGQGSNTPLNPDGTINMDAWNEEANKACREALAALPAATNPSGACVCYNLPALNNVTGTFRADLRLFQVSQPSGDFSGIPQDRIEVGLTYQGASVSPDSSGPRAAAPGSNNGTNANELPLLQSYSFVGQIDEDAMDDEIDMARLQALVMPVVTLSATNADGQKVSTNVSMNEAAFVAGVFSQEVVMSTFRQAELAVEEEMERLKNGETAFVLPGVQILIFPVGLIITSIWLVLGCAAYGYGTFARYNFREQHRRMVARAEKGGMARI
ncbi:hypothetical protein QBC38DRAFT_122064 [Podospora fimiseda]|uniref:Uncharacterized protein n=1 Tax=Podospora fimiseda TaxID=252190 RepID=A0AAN6YNF0_9PEZI|nr:hypothetical protein QBC38DRAFT_122064 [Podospora fimiseda]